MPIQRRLSWNAALRDMRSDRTRVAIGVVSAHSLIRGLIRIRRTSRVTLTGAFNRSALMAIAVEAAKAHQLRTGAAWSVSMSVGLTAAWQAAKDARLSVVTREQGLIKPKRKDTHRCGFPPLRAAEGEGRTVRCGSASLQSPATLLRPHPGARAFPEVAANLISAPR